ncbi:MAG TPA: hypothetical protein VMU94_10085 [Streptosporangiaceae bacterium]|nr:hypothetical protein [Streptosporangiaceae bacterium]
MNCEHCGTVFEPRREHGRARAIAMISEAVWWVTIVDGTLVRYHPSVYDAVLAGHLPAELRQIEGILAGLRFVRDQMGHDIDHADFIHRAEEAPVVLDRAAVSCLPADRIGELIGLGVVIERAADEYCVPSPSLLGLLDDAIDDGVSAEAPSRWLAPSRRGCGASPARSRRRSARSSAMSSAVSGSCSSTTPKLPS